MFTGIVEELGTLISCRPHGNAATDGAGTADEGAVSEAATLTVRAATVCADTRPGDSIAVNGVCLTAVTVDDHQFTADVMRETLQRSSLGGLVPGDQVNLERAATLSTRLGGHLVQGHVDGVGTIRSRVPGQRWERVRVGMPAGLTRYVVEKGSVAVDGVSLTVTAVADDWFEVSLIPTTLRLTTLGNRAVGEQVNVEVDVIAKYVEKLTGAGS